METEQIILEALEDKIDLMKEYISNAESCLSDRDYIQCAVRLEKAADMANFSEFQLQIFDSMSPSKS